MARTTRWTQQHSDTVRRLARAGASRSRIAAAVGCSITTLRRRFADELADRRPAFETHVPQVEAHRAVYLLAGLGIAPADIAAALGCSPDHLIQTFSRELNAAAVWMNALVGLALLKNALWSGNVAAQVFWLKARAGWGEYDAARENAPATSARNLEDIVRSDIGRLSSKGRKALRVVLTELGAKSPLNDPEAVS